MTPDRFSGLPLAPERPVVTGVRNERLHHPNGYHWRLRRVVMIGGRRESFGVNVLLSRHELTAHRAETANRLRLARRWIQQRVAKMARVGAPE